MAGKGASHSKVAKTFATCAVEVAGLNLGRETDCLEGFRGLNLPFDAIAGIAP